MKYILTSGCSFTNNVRYDRNNKKASVNWGSEEHKSWPYYLQQEVGDDYEVWNLGGATNDNVSIIRVLFYEIKELLDSGVNGEDIIVIGQWSDIHRKAIYTKNQFTDWDYSWREHSLKYSCDDGGFFLTGGFGPPDSENGTMETLGLTKMVHEYDINVLQDTYHNETLQWLETLSFFQNFCIENDIEHYWVWMRNNLSQEAYDVHFGAPNMDSDSTSTNTWLENVDMFRPYMDEVSLFGSNCWFYKNYNGMLEWCYDNYGDLNPYQETENMTVEDYFQMQPNKWGHPSNIMNEKFVKEELLKLIGYGKNG